MKYSNLSVPKNIPFTKEGVEKNQRDYDNLLEKRKEILVRLQAAREMGDLSENGAYTAAKFELRNTDRELRRLKYLLRFGVVTDKNDGGVIDFGSSVTLDDGKEKMIFLMVSGFESNPGLKKLSIDSPLGKAIFGKKAGDKITLTMPDGSTEYLISKVD